MYMVKINFEKKTYKFHALALFDIFLKIHIRYQQNRYENTVHKFFDASSKMIRLPSVYQDFNLLRIYFSQ